MIKQVNCQEPTCRNFQRYCRLHLVDVVKEPKPLAKVADARKEQEKEYLKLRKEYLRQHPFCAVNNCKQAATDIHHSAGRSGDKLLDVKDFVAMCRHHHQYFEVRPLLAKAEGISKSRLGKSKKSVQ